MNSPITFHGWIEKILLNARRNFFPPLFPLATGALLGTTGRAFIDVEPAEDASDDDDDDDDADGACLVSDPTITAAPPDPSWSESSIAESPL